METFKATIELPKQRIIDLFISACEGGSNYWCQSLTPPDTRKDAYEAMLDGFTLIDGETSRQHLVTPKDIAKAIELFPIKAPQAFADVMGENDDACTGYVFLQLCVFKDIIYG